MKKLFVLTIFTIFGFMVAHSQSNWKVGVNAGIPVGDVQDFSSFNLGVDVAYLFNVSDVFGVGPLVGYSHFFGQNDFEDISFLPLAASGRFSFSDQFFVGADLGYAVGVDDGNDGGFYYRPKLGYNFGKLALIASYSGIEIKDTGGGTVGSINLGIELGF
jgi:hypothetical protein